MRPSTPLSVSTHVGPSSPPQTPTAASYPPLLSRKVSTTKSPGPGAGSGGYTPPNLPIPFSQPPNLMSLGNGQFNSPFPVRPEELSPRSFDHSAEVSGPETESSDDESRSPSPPPTSAYDVGSTDGPETIVVKDNFIIEELSDFDEHDMEGRDDVLQPDAIEDAESERSLSRSQLRPDDLHLDRHVINDLRDLNFRSPGRETSSDGSDMSDAEHRKMIQRMRAEDRRKRQSLSSIAKRTMSERSDSDHEDVRHCLNFEEVGSSARRLKRKVDDRRSLIFQDPPPRIDEMDEPPEELDDTEMLAKELPFYAYTTMEVDSPRSDYYWDQVQ
ncbi:hypothetical protein VM1G_07719 [Cytospora mali]|uniref:Uncharacterized protein n=1 Tax=Cytospora mali TaxID=578113 RepID=A0A194W7E7_CYTMA|nr:hypothetical protein VM1G_07719 [Valsa mali]